MGRVALTAAGWIPPTTNSKKAVLRLLRPLAGRVGERVGTGKPRRAAWRAPPLGGAPPLSFATWQPPGGQLGGHLAAPLASQLSGVARSRAHTG
eukprot:1183538-Prorocentrum_minimum.AAC.1